MNPEACIVCGILITVPQEAPKASWGPITLYFHASCGDRYAHSVAPRLKFSILNAIRRWEHNRHEP